MILIHNFTSQLNDFLSKKVGLKTMVLKMRLRRASTTRRRTQVQIPLAAFRHRFFTGVEGVTSRHTYQFHYFCIAYARGKVNTVKVELPEIHDMIDPVIRFERGLFGNVYYNVYDAASDDMGRDIRISLLLGHMAGAVRTTRRDLSHATLYEFIK